MVPKKHFSGNWVSSLPFDSDDYLIEYIITPKGQSFDVRARDFRDGEEMEISEIRFDGEELSFKSYMPSTHRRGQNIMKLVSKDKIRVEFTFTVIEELKRPDPNILRKLRGE